MHSTFIITIYDVLQCRQSFHSIQIVYTDVIMTVFHIILLLIFLSKSRFSGHFAFITPGFNGNNFTDVLSKS